METQDTKPLLEKEEGDHEIHQIGRKRAASSMSRLIGYMAVRPGNPQPTLIASILNLEKDPGIDNLRRILISRVLRIPRFRSRMVFGKGRPHWEEVEFDAGYHFEVLGFGRKVSEDEVMKFVGETKARSLDIRHPLWKCIHVPEMEDGSCRIIFVISHVIGDGVGLVNALLFRIVDEAPELEKKRDAVVKKRSKRPTLPLGTKLRVYAHGTIQGHTGAFWRQDKKNPLKLMGPPSSTKLLARSEKRIPVDDLKNLAKQIGTDVTINDVLMAVFAKTLAYYMRDVAKEDPKTIKSRKMRVNFPVNMRKGVNESFNEHGDTNNRFVLAMLGLPLVNFETGKDLVLDLKRKMDEVKSSPALPILDKTPGRLMKGMNPNMIVDTVFNATNIPTCCLSNVPGPQELIHLAGVAITEFEFFLFTAIGVYFGIFSYNGQVSATVNVDAKLGVDPKALANLFYPSFLEIYNEVCGVPPQ